MAKRKRAHRSRPDSVSGSFIDRPAPVRGAGRRLSRMRPSLWATAAGDRPHRLWGVAGHCCIRRPHDFVRRRLAATQAVSGWPGAPWGGPHWAGAGVAPPVGEEERGRCRGNLCRQLKRQDLRLRGEIAADVDDHIRRRWTHPMLRLKGHGAGFGGQSGIRTPSRWRPAACRCRPRPVRPRRQPRAAARRPPVTVRAEDRNRPCSPECRRRLEAHRIRQGRHP